MVLRQFATNVPEFLQIHGGRPLGRLDTERGQTPRPAGSRLVVLAFGGFRQGEEGLGGVDRGGDTRLVQTMVGHNPKAEPGEGGAQLIAERLKILVIQGHGDRGDG